MDEKLPWKEGVDLVVSLSSLWHQFCCYFAVYLGLFSASEIIQHRNEPSYRISISRAVGGALGFIGGIYGSYLLCVLVGIGDDVSSIDSSGIVVGVCFGSAEASRQMGSFLGNALLHR